MNKQEELLTKAKEIIKLDSDFEINSISSEEIVLCVDSRVGNGGNYEFLTIYVKDKYWNWDSEWNLEPSFTKEIPKIMGWK